MSNYVIALAIVGVMSVPAAAQPAPPPQNAPATNQAQPQMVKKTICEDNDNPSTTIHRICRTVMVPAKPVPSASNKPPQNVDGPNSGY